MPRDETDRRQKLKERLQDRIRCRQQNGPMTEDRRLQLCEADLKSLMEQIDLCAPMGFPLESHVVCAGASGSHNVREIVQTIKWTVVIESVEQTLTTCDQHLETHHRKHLGVGRKAMLNKPMVKILEEAHFFFKRLKANVAKLPRDLVITNPEEFGLRTRRRVVQNIEAPGRWGTMDTGGYTEFG